MDRGGEMGGTLVVASLVLYFTAKNNILVYALINARFLEDRIGYTEIRLF
jgi:hypothetical protein